MVLMAMSGMDFFNLFFFKGSLRRCRVYIPDVRLVEEKVKRERTGHSPHMPRPLRFVEITIVCAFVYGVVFVS